MVSFCGQCTYTYNKDKVLRMSFNDTNVNGSNNCGRRTKKRKSNGYSWVQNSANAPSPSRVNIDRRSNNLVGACFDKKIIGYGTWTATIHAYDASTKKYACQYADESTEYYTREDWTCAAINFHDKTITYYDSLGGKGENVLQTLLRYLKEEHEKKKDSPLPNPEEYQLISLGNSIPQQSIDSLDCGVFMCQFLNYLSNNDAFNFNQSHMSNFRMKMCLEILNKQLFD